MPTGVRRTPQESAAPSCSACGDAHRPGLRRVGVGRFARRRLGLRSRQGLRRRPNRGAARGGPDRLRRLLRSRPPASRQRRRQRRHQANGPADGSVLAIRGSARDGGGPLRRRMADADARSGGQSAKRRRRPLSQTTGVRPRSSGRRRQTGLSEARHGGFGCRRSGDARPGARATGSSSRGGCPVRKASIQSAARSAVRTAARTGCFAADGAGIRRTSDKP